MNWFSVSRPQWLWRSWGEHIQSRYHHELQVSWHSCALNDLLFNNQIECNCLNCVHLNLILCQLILCQSDSYMVLSLLVTTVIMSQPMKQNNQHKKHQNAVFIRFMFHSTNNIGFMTFTWFAVLVIHLSMMVLEMILYESMKFRIPILSLTSTLCQVKDTKCCTWVP